MGKENGQHRSPSDRSAPDSSTPGDFRLTTPKVRIETGTLVGASDGEVERFPRHSLRRRAGRRLALASAATPGALERIARGN